MLYRLQSPCRQILGFVILRYINKIDLMKVVIMVFFVVGKISEKLVCLQPNGLKCMTRYNWS